PAPPADLQPLVQVDLIHAEHDRDGCQRAEHQHLADEAVPVLLLQRIVEAIAPLIEEDVVADERKLDGDHGGEQRSPGEPILRSKIGRSDPPYAREGRANVVHRLASPGTWAQGPEVLKELGALRLKSQFSQYGVACRRIPDNPSMGPRARG